MDAQELRDNIQYIFAITSIFVVSFSKPYIALFYDQYVQHFVSIVVVGILSVLCSFIIQNEDYLKSIVQSGKRYYWNMAFSFSFNLCLCVR